MPLSRLAGVVFVAAIYLPAPVLARQACSPVDHTKLARHVTIELDWLKLKECIDKNASVETKVGERIDEDTTVTVKVTNLNFVLYTPSMAIDETVVETYVTLEKLWAQLLGLPMLGGAAPTGGITLSADACASFPECVAQWAYKVSLADRELSTVRDRHKGLVVLGVEQRMQVQADAAKLKELQDEVVDFVAKFLARDLKPQTMQQVTDFETARSRQDSFFDKLAAYQASATLVRDGQLIHIGKKKPGTIVSITLTAKDRTQAPAAPVASIEYFVHSRLPLVMHVGYSYSKVNDVEFKVIRGLAQSDLFVKVKENDGTSNMVAFLSAGQTYFSEKLGVFGSIGTDFNVPGERVYLGGSLQFWKRVVVTMGWVSASEDEGGNSVQEQIGNATDKRELFLTIQSKRDWHGFGAISFRVF